MRTYDEDRRLIVGFLNETNMKAYDLARISKDLCTCSTCRFYCQHYDADGNYVPFGHCNRVKNRAKKPHEASCGFWDCN